jgi:mono/diheme cytochrome c family protein
MRRWIPLALVASVATALFVIAADRWLHRELPITDLPAGLHYISPEEWYGAPKKRQLYQTTGWVLLPQTPESQIADPTITRDSPRPGYVGPEVCAECHQERYDGFVQTAHARTTRQASPETIRGSFAAGSNRLATRDPRLHFTMVQKEGGFYQQVTVEQDRSYIHEQRVDIVAGSANHGQSFLYWMDNRLYELPVTYFTELDRWVNSPGYPDGTADFARPINARCLECHATYFESVPGTENEFVPERSILGVSCERCHGPGSRHVSHHRDRPDETEAQHIVHPALLPRSRLIEVCAQCHSGAGKARLKPPFTYQPGERLDEFMILDQPDRKQKGNVHTANQLVRLSLSRCYRESTDLTCTSCHDPHKDEHAQHDIFAERCLKCHEIAQCGGVDAMGSLADANCISCHMPLRHDEKIRLQGPQADQLPLIRDHFIRVFPQSRPVRQNQVD